MFKYVFIKILDVVINNYQVIFATGFERILFKTAPSYLSILGTIIIMGSAIYIAVR